MREQIKFEVPKRWVTTVAIDRVKSINTSLVVKGLRDISFLAPSLPRGCDRQSKIYKYALGSERVYTFVMWGISI